MKTVKNVYPFPGPIPVLILVLMVLGAVVLFDGKAYAAATPSDVYATVDLTDRVLNALIGVEKTDDSESEKRIETDISPMHVYQMSVSVSDALIRLQGKKGMRPGFAVSAYPREYIPEDVLRLNDWILSEVMRTTRFLKNNDVPVDKRYFSNKKPVDVFHRLLKVFFKIRRIGEFGDVTPNEVFSQMERVTADIKAVLKTIDPHLRYRIDVKKSRDDLVPGDVFAECIQLRKDLNMLREKFGMKKVNVPDPLEKSSIKPRDVFIQTQILIAEMNNIKIGTGTGAVTPIAVEAEEKKPSDVHQKAALTRYLVNQVLNLQDMMKEIANQ